MLAAWIFIAASIVLPSDSARSAEKRHRDSSDRCVERIKERTSAYVAEDWPRVKELASQYVARCTGVFDTENLSDAYEDVAKAEIEQQRYSLALQASDQCLNVWYSNAGCHVIRLQALLALGHRGQARTELQRTEKLIDNAIETGSHEMGSDEPSEAARREAILEKLRALRTLISRIHEVRFPGPPN